VTSASDIDPNAVVPIADASDASLRIVIARLERSTRFQHYILRADEIDAVWRHLDTALKAAPAEGVPESEVERLRRRLRAVLEAHDLVTSGSAQEAAARLRSELES
jgi:hypothetical protein